MGGFSPAWYVSIAIAVVLVLIATRDLPPSCRKGLGILAFLLFTIGVGGIVCDFHSTYELRSPLDSELIFRWPVMGRKPTSTVKSQFIIYGDFLPAYNNVVGHKLGKQVGNALSAQRAEAVEGLYSKGTLAIFIGPEGHFILRNFPQTWEKLDWEYSADPSIYSTRKMRERFPSCKTPKLPPYGGIAQLEMTHEFKWLGCAEWRCLFNNKDQDLIHYQVFEHGQMIGPLRWTGNLDNHSGHIFTLFDDHTWERTGADVDGPPSKDCTEGHFPP